MSTAASTPRSPRLGGLVERLTELEARRLGVLPLDAAELAAVAELAALIVGLLGREATVRGRPLPGQALAGAHALRGWARAIADEPPGDSLVHAQHQEGSA